MNLTTQLGRSCTYHILLHITSALLHAVIRYSNGAVLQLLVLMSIVMSAIRKCFRVDVNV